MVGVQCFDENKGSRWPSPSLVWGRGPCSVNAATRASSSMMGPRFSMQSAFIAPDHIKMGHRALC